VESLTPAGWRPLLDQFRAVLLAVRQRAPALPSSVVHGDPWPGNAIHTGRDEVTLIGWENAGLGLPLLDWVSACSSATWTWAAQDNRPPGTSSRTKPDRRHRGGILRWRRLQPAEKDLLPEGIRFPAAYVGAIHFEQALLAG
jgi:aminoglycoside phosphotransferase (APT) family kinase protein